MLSVECRRVIYGVTRVYAVCWIPCVMFMNITVFIIILSPIQRTHATKSPSSSSAPAREGSHAHDPDSDRQVSSVVYLGGCYGGCREREKEYDLVLRSLDVE